MLEVVPDIVGKPPEGYILSKTEVVPLQVTVRGPESKVRDDIPVNTYPVDVSEFTQSTEIEAALIPPSPDIRFAGPNPVVRIRLVIEKEGEETEPAEKKAPVKKKPATK